MTVGELKFVLENVPDNATVCFCSDGENPYDDYWVAEGIVRITNCKSTNEGLYDRICFTN